MNGRDELSFGDRFEMDVWYVDNWSLKLDLKILARTVVKVIRSSDVVIGQVDEGPPDEAMS